MLVYGRLGLALVGIKRFRHVGHSPVGMCASNQPRATLNDQEAASCASLVSSSRLFNPYTVLVSWDAEFFLRVA